MTATGTMTAIAGTSVTALAAPITGKSYISRLLGTKPSLTDGVCSDRDRDSKDDRDDRRENGANGDDRKGMKQLLYMEDSRTC